MPVVDGGVSSFVLFVFVFEDAVEGCFRNGGAVFGSATTPRP